MITEAQIEERKSCIGGSDLANVMSLEPYGCAKRLWLQKRDVKPDYPLITTEAMERGTRLEDVAAGMYTENTGRTLRMSNLTHRLGDYPWAAVHIDRHIVAENGGGPGVLELKTASTYAFKKMLAEGLPLGYIAQLQWGMHVKGWGWGSFGILSLSPFELVPFDVDYDEDLAQGLFDQAQTFWRMVENGPEPERLEPKDRRCQQCPWRRQCQGEALLEQIKGEEGVCETDESLAPAVGSLIEAEGILSEAKEWADKCKEALKSQIGERSMVEAGGYRLHYRPQTTKRVKPQVLKAKHPEIYEACSYESVSRPLRKFAI